jgi:hypothetical protein
MWELGKEEFPSFPKRGKKVVKSQESESLERQLADAAAKQKAKLAQLTALRNSYPVN